MRFVNAVIAAEISSLTRYYDRVVQCAPRPEDAGHLLAAIDCKRKQLVAEPAALPDLGGETDLRTAVLLNGTLNHHLDIQGLLAELRPKLARTSRLVLVAYNPYLAWLYRLANALGIREGEQPTTFVTRVDLTSIARLAGFEIVRIRPVAYVPWRALGVGLLANFVLGAVPLVRWLGLASVIVLRPTLKAPGRPSLSVVIPARNERGNIEAALKRMPDLGCELEVIFVEGHSNDGTWEEIERVCVAYRHRFRLRALRQTGRGKADAVRLGFAEATGDLLTILDADLTMPPELLGRFYDAYCQGLADFVNGSRLVYPMEGEAMRFLNRLGNRVFAVALSSVLDMRIGDSLCGTKLLARHDYARLTAWRADFGEFDPFGDFELLFAAAVLGLGVVEVAIRYRARTYGATNISRFRHGSMLLRMTLIGLLRIKTGRLPSRAASCKTLDNAPAP